MRRAVIDQPGTRTLLIGLALSVFLGLALRSQISEARVQVFLSKSIDRLQTDFYIDYESAKVNLSRWGLPLPALIIQNLRLSPKSTICQSSQIYIAELEVPISLATLLGLSKTVPKIRVKEVELRLSDLQECLNHKKDAKSEANPGASGTEADFTHSSEAEFKNIFSKNTKAELKEIYIEKLKIISNNRPEQPVVLKQINLELFYTENRLREVQIKSKISALKDSRSDVYFLNSSLVAMIKARENNEIETLFNVSGKLLDGDVQLFIHSISGSHKLTYELGLQQVSIKAMAPILENFEFYKRLNVEKIPVSISLVNNGEVTLSGKSGLESRFKKILVNVEKGQIKINELDAAVFNEQVSIKPFVMSVESLQLTKLKNIDQFKNRLDGLDNLGELSGTLDYQNENSFKFKGQVRNIVVVFSNRGRRDHQSIELVDVETSRNAQEFRFDASEFVINNQKVTGQLKVAYNISDFTTTANLKLSGITLNSKIWEQFTFVEQSPRVELIWHYKKAVNETHNIRILADHIALPGMKLDALNVDLLQVLTEEPSNNSLHVQIKPAKLSTDKSFLEHDVINGVLTPANGFKLESLSSTNTSLVLSGTDWKNVNFNLNSQFLSDFSPRSDTRLTLRGAVRYEGRLDGRLVMQNRVSTSKFDLSRDSADKIIIKQLVIKD